MGHLPTLESDASGRVRITWPDGRRSEGHITKMNVQMGRGSLGEHTQTLDFTLTCFEPMLSEEASTMKAAADEANKRVRENKAKKEGVKKMEEDRLKPVRDFIKGLEQF